jgi:hypothetical protein
MSPVLAQSRHGDRAQPMSAFRNPAEEFRMAVELYHFWSSVCSVRCRMALEEKGVPWTSRYIDARPDPDPWRPTARHSVGVSGARRNL